MEDDGERIARELAAELLQLHVLARERHARGQPGTFSPSEASRSIELINEGFEHPGFFMKIAVELMTVGLLDDAGALQLWRDFEGASIRTGLSLVLQ